MKKWVTEIKAIDPTDGQLKTWTGPSVEAETQEKAEEWCRKHAGYMVIHGELVEEIDSDDVKSKSSRWCLLPELIK